MKQTLNYLQINKGGTSFAVLSSVKPRIRQEELKNTDNGLRIIDIDEEDVFSEEEPSETIESKAEATWSKQITVNISSTISVSFKAKDPTEETARLVRLLSEHKL